MNEAALVFFTVKEILNLNINDPTDIYCVISVEKQIIRTSSCKVSKSNPIPEWKEGFTFDVISQESTIEVAIWGKSLKTSGRLLGILQLPIYKVKEKRVLEKVVCVVDENYDVSKVEISFKANYASPNHKVGFDDFIMLKYIGSGSFGKVMLVKKKDTGRLYATKIMRKDILYREGLVDFPFIERHLLKKYNHPNVVKLKYCFQTDTHLYMVMDYISGGELYDLLEARVLLKEDEARFFAAQIVLAIGFLHEHDVVYRDLKPENCLLDMRGDLCLIDFGLSKEGVRDGDPATSFCGSLQYMAPEILKGRPYGKAVDWWALGVIIYEMLTGCHPFINHNESDISEKDVLDRVVGASPEWLPTLSKDAVNLIKLLLCKEPTLRLGSVSAQEIKNHSFFSKVHWKNLELKRVDPPLKPHLDKKDHVIDPWACGNANDDSNFEILSVSQQEQFKSFSYVSPIELSRSASSPVIGSLSFVSPVSSLSFVSPLSPRLRSNSPRLSPRLSSSSLLSSPLSSSSLLSSPLSPPSLLSSPVSPLSPVSSLSPSSSLSSSPLSRKGESAFRVVKSSACFNLSQFNNDDEIGTPPDSPAKAKFHISQHREREKNE